MLFGQAQVLKYFYYHKDKLSMTAKNLPLIFSFMSILGLMQRACSHLPEEGNGSQPKIIKGRTIDEHEFPAVVKLILKDPKGEYLGVCTGQFITAVTLLTAAHCLEDEAQAFLTLTDRTEPSSKIFLHPRYQAYDPESTRFDLVLLRFSHYEHPSTLELAQDPPQPGTEVILIGYGKDRFTTKPGAGIGVKRQGLAKIHQQGAGILQLSFSPDSGVAAAAPGDSGGALLLASGTLAGVTSVGAPESESIIINQYVDLSSPESKAFFRDAAAAGWSLPKALTEP